MIGWGCGRSRRCRIIQLTDSILLLCTELQCTQHDFPFLRSVLLHQRVNVNQRSFSLVRVSIVSIPLPWFIAMQIDIRSWRSHHGPPPCRHRSTPWPRSFVICTTWLEHYQGHCYVMLCPNPMRKAISTRGFIGGFSVPDFHVSLAYLPLIAAAKTCSVARLLASLRISRRGCGPPVDNALRHCMILCIWRSDQHHSPAHYYAMGR